MRIKYLIAVIFLLIMPTSCIKTKCDDDALTPLSSYNGNQLKTDGYYYSFKEHNQWDGDIYDVYVFYRNGVMIRGGLTGDLALEHWEGGLKTGVYNSGLMDIKSSWGDFFVDISNIQLQWWTDAYCGRPAWSTTGIILNDTTFVLLKKEKLKGGSSSQLNDTFHFKQFCCKPDSTNDFVK